MIPPSACPVIDVAQQKQPRARVVLSNPTLTAGPQAGELQGGRQTSTEAAQGPDEGSGYLFDHFAALTAIHAQ
jgi:hypothetical protein